MHRWLGASLWLVVLLQPAATLAQQEEVKPYVLLLFDTSGSMIWPVCYSSYSAINGDNSTECPGKDMSCTGSGSCNTFGCGNGIPDDTRLYKVKKGAHSVVSAFGEVTFALARFRNVKANFTCNAPSARRAGGWAGQKCNVTVGTQGNQADVLVGFSSNNQSELLQWMNNCSDYPSAGQCGAPPNSASCSLCADCGSGCDKELRGVSSTPLAGALYDVRANYLPTVFAADSQKLACRPYKVILLTDGQNTCNGNPPDQAEALFTHATKSVPVHVVGFGDSSLKPKLDAIAQKGGTGQAIIVDNEVSLALAMANIVSESIMREKCNNADDDCDNYCDETFPEVAVTNPACLNQHAAQTCSVGVGICKNTGTWKCKADGSGSECNVSPLPGKPTEICNNGLDDNCNGAIDEGCLPCAAQPEVCDGKDNDCDSLVDEDYTPVKCGSSIGECAQGTTSCVGGKVVCNGAKPPENELCDNKDNNCDTVVDMFAEACYPPGDGNGCNTTTMACQGMCQIGSRLCTNGAWGSCFGYQGPSTEACNGVDDDCDGSVDEGVTNTCVDYKNCAPYVTCAACPQAPPEICDGKDNDCNGKVDDNPLYVGDPCGKPVGECTKGTYVCENGKLVCKGGAGPTPEVCDGKDNDCNGAVDDNVPGEGDVCGDSTGECEPGKKKCIDGKWICVGGVGPTKEICDGKDNDCDGKTDEMAECPGASLCVEGKCMLPCKPGEFSCPGGTTCTNGYCLPDKCTGVKCKETERCVDGKCIEKCSGVSCADHEKCDPKTGQCVDDSCLTKGCPDGKSCVNYKCVENPCPPGKCPDGQMCIAGKCLETCANVTCPKGQVCFQGVCTTDPCAGITCPANHTCKVSGDKGQCVPDPCRFVSCGPGEICREGKCIADPCKAATCPEGFVCTVSHAGEADCAILEGQAAVTEQMLASGGGGCACDTGAGSGGGGPLGAGLLLLVGFFLVRSRRR